MSSDKLFSVRRLTILSKDHFAEQYSLFASDVRYLFSGHFL